MSAGSGHEGVARSMRLHQRYEDWCCAFRFSVNGVLAECKDESPQFKADLLAMMQDAASVYGATRGDQ